ncbi:MAG: hydrogenase [Ignavibacteriales bacterium CG_4_9_14_3_um_filter_30_11]|nr:MAG: hydrogenase [Ignavibacteriales bacterium CG_4_9_14_3_um_filter_30_11]
MISLQVQNNEPFSIDEISFLNRNDFQATVFEGLTSGYRMIGLFPINKLHPHKIISILADSDTSLVYLIGGEFPKDKLEFDSFANQFPQTNYFECELSENFGFNPINHPWLRPVRKQNIVLGNKPYQFYKLEGDEVHEVAVGPIHAGVIEPGHFRFQCHGELVYHLEINLGYQHRGVESLMLNSNAQQRIIISESIAGDSVVAHTYAHCNAIESLSNTQISLRVQMIRSIAEELERIAMHLSGLGGIANDIGFSIVSASYGRLRTIIINSLAALCGSRFGRGLFVYGGVRFDLTDEIIKQIKNNLETVKKDIASINEYLFSSTGALIRFEQTGTVTNDFASEIGLVGFAARVCGIELDARINFPYGVYRYFPVFPTILQTGDVFARTHLRTFEIDESIRFISEQFDSIPKGVIQVKMSSITANTGVISIVEGWRGEVVHVAITDNNGKISQYKIKDPSFTNWYGLNLALRETAISDFPLCNKSFDLSYSGHDL